MLPGHAPDGLTTKTYKIAVTRQTSTNDNLSSIIRSAGILTPFFSPTTTSYTKSVAHGVTTLTITPTASDPDASITVNGAPLSASYPSFTQSAAVPLVVGVNTIHITVKASDSTTTKTYTIKATRAVSDNANLADLTASIGPPFYFSPVTYSYALTVPHEDSVMTVIPYTAVRVSTVKVNGIPVVSGSASGPITLANGPNTISVVATALDGVTTNTYTLTVTRIGAVNSNLAGLTTTAGAISPAFTGTTASYEASVTYADSVITVTPTASDPGAAITVNGIPTASMASAPIALSVGGNDIDIKVVASDGSSSMDYQLYVTRSTSTESDPDLSFLSVIGGNLTPAFAPGIVNYTDTTANNVTGITVEFGRLYWDQDVYVNGTLISGESDEAGVSLSPGTKTISVQVFAEDGIANKTYTLNVYTPVSSDDNLSSVSLIAGGAYLTDLSPAFAAATTSYTAAVPDADSTIKVVPVVSNPTSTIKVNGTTVVSQTASLPIALAVGSTTINTQVTASDQHKRSNLHYKCKPPAAQ